VGADHLKLTVRSAEGGGQAFDAIAFKQAHHFELVKSGAPFSLLYTVEENEWQGRRSIQLNIKDIKAGSVALLEGETAARADQVLS
jgi:single-stranded-DNA-specific exonuclease